MGKLKDYFSRTFEAFFVLGTLIAMSLVNYFFGRQDRVSQFLFLADLLAAAHYLGTRKAVPSAARAIVFI